MLGFSPTEYANTGKKIQDGIFSQVVPLNPDENNEDCGRAAALCRNCTFDESPKAASK
jgi:hypothetical protein